MAQQAQVAVVGGTYVEAAEGAGSPFSPAGAAARTAVLLARMGCRVFLISALGSDIEGNEVMGRLRKGGVNVDFAKQVDSVPSMKLEKSAGSPKKADPAGSADVRNFIDKEVLLATRAMLSSCDVMVMTADVPEETFRFGLEISHYYRVPVIVRAEPVEGLPREALPGVDVLVADQEETKALAGRTVKDLADAAACLRLLLGMGAGAALIMLEGMGVAGAMSVEEPFFVPAPFAGEGARGWNRSALLACLARSLAAGVPLRTAGFAACAAAALAGDDATPDMRALEKEILKTTALTVGEDQ